jgi:hypothetical protein
MKGSKMSKSPKAPKAPKEIAQVSSVIVTAYQNITADTLNLNEAGLDFLLLVGQEMATGRVSGREYRASLEQAKVNPLVAVKPAHAEIIPTACEILSKLGRENVTVAKLLSLSTRVKRSGTEISSNETIEALDERTPTIKEISDSKKSDSDEETVEIAVPTLDALIIGFVAELKKLSKGEKIKSLQFDALTTPALEEMKVILGTISKNGIAK